MAVLEIKNMQKRFEGVVALDHVDFSCEKGKITGLLGANGSGKSTLSKIITGVYHADDGEIIYEGKQVAFTNPAESKKNGISMVFQNLSLVEDLRVWENIVLGSESRRGVFLDDDDARKKAVALIEELSPGLDVERYVYQLSPGEMQIVEIAKALVDRPKLLILDEPTASLENEQVRRLFRYMRRLVGEGIAMIFTSHRMKEVMEICDMVTVFKNGKNVGHMDFSVDERDEGAVVRMITGNSDAEPAAKAQRCERILPDNVLFEVKDLKFTGKLRGVSFQVKKGEILGIGGLSGQGQEELMLALAGNYPRLQGGTFRLQGRELQLRKPSQAIEHGIFLVPGDRNTEGLFLNHTVYDNFVYPRLAKKKHRLLVPAKKYREESEAVIKTLSIVTKGLDTKVRTLSGGNAQKLVIGKWLNFEMNLLLLSDPAKGVDVSAKQDMYAFIKNMTEKTGMGVVLYASDAQELATYCDRVLVMFEGQVVAELCGDGVREDTIYEATMCGTSCVS